MSTAIKTLQEIEFTGGHPAVDFVNTVHSWQAKPPPDYLHAFDDFIDWNLMSGLLWPRSAAHFKALPDAKKARVFEEARELRGNLHRVLVAMTKGEALSRKALDHLNDIIRRTAAWRRLAADAESGYRSICCVWHFKDAPAVAALGPVAWIAADLLQTGRTEYLKECPGEGCGWLFIDASKNHSRHWCSMKTCGNTAKVNRFRRRASA